MYLQKIIPKKYYGYTEYYWVNGSISIKKCIISINVLSFKNDDFGRNLCKITLTRLNI
jgi:hypothetical protein